FVPEIGEEACDSQLPLLDSQELEMLRHPPDGIFPGLGCRQVHLAEVEVDAVSRRLEERAAHARRPESPPVAHGAGGDIHRRRNAERAEDWTRVDEVVAVAVVEGD